MNENLHARHRRRLKKRVLEQGAEGLEPHVLLELLLTYAIARRDTNELAHRLLSPKRHVWKCYEAAVDGPLNAQDAAAFAAGLELSDFTALPAELEILRSSPQEAVAQVRVREGKFHQVRRMFAARGRTVTALRRLSLGPLTLDASLQPGEYRELTAQELTELLAAVSKEDAE